MSREDEQLEEFRRRAREWLASKAPEHGWLRGEAPVDETEEQRLARARECQRMLHDAGFAGITWPTEYGGQGLTNREQVVFNREASHYELPTTVFIVGLGMCAPTILALGTEEQKRRYLPPLVRGEEIWCQLFSEPGAGSDVAGLEASARRDGDEWVLNGQKVWTSAAHHARFGIVLARSEPDVPKHRGLTMFVLDMQAPGVTIRPLRQMNGQAQFNEVFLDDVRLPADAILGEVNEGWRAAITTLMNERVSIGAGRSSGDAHEAVELIELAQRRARAGDANVRQALADVYVRERILRMLGQRITDAVMAGRVPGPEGSIAKLAGSGLSKRSAELAVDLVGAGATAWAPTEAGADRWADVLLLAPGLSIAGGTDEVLRNVIGERVLGLPKEPDHSRDLAFSEVRRRVSEQGSV